MGIWEYIQNSIVCEWHAACGCIEYTANEGNGQNQMQLLTKCCKSIIWFRTQIRTHWIGISDRLLYGKTNQQLFVSSDSFQELWISDSIHPNRKVICKENNLFALRVFFVWVFISSPFQIRWIYVNRNVCSFAYSFVFTSGVWNTINTSNKKKMIENRLKKIRSLGV